jgi:ABC-type lipoprotein release transport system permease subunit
VSVIQNRIASNKKFKKMTEAIDEILGKKDKIIIGVLILFIFTLIIALSLSGYFDDDVRNNILEREYSGTVTEKYIDYKDHASPKIKLSNGTEIYNCFPKQKVVLQIGDSVVKQHNSIYILLFRNKQFIRTIDLLNK